jgi:hypothetical protein
MDSVLEVFKMIVGLKDNPMALVVIFALGSMALAAWSIYAVIVVARGSATGEQ